MKQQSLFNNMSNEPLANRLRPTTLDEYVGQKHLIGPGKILYQLINSDIVPSMIFWGPPGVGKTTLARIIANQTKANFINFSAVTSGIKDIRTVMKKAQEVQDMGEKTIVFVDEIHRFNKAQQDAFLPYVEQGSIILIGATTENPSFEINSALLSRCKVFVLKSLTTEDIAALLNSAIISPKGFKEQNIVIDDDLLYMIAGFSNGDARVALNTLEMAILNGIVKDQQIIINKEVIEQCINQKSLLYDKKGEEHYNIISALHKSMRNSDVDASIYWMARMIEAGEDPLYVARRLIRFASEDIGMADSRALEIAVATYQACHFNGMPECNVNLAHCVTYLALAPKSNALYKAYEKAKHDALNTIADPVPLQIRNAPTRLMKELNYGKGYQYAHDFEEKITNMQCLPNNIKDHRYYFPTNQGTEAKVIKRMEQIAYLRKKYQKSEK
ncbi:replication-associated recombination protein A [Thomasclavelia cocleata]|uniref:Recombination protein MgsA n=1 Tax=Thomasclavelia cocleata TaxID=69824 RepID=A0A1I0EKU8_9FIRM|nr:replication-associated recombination protein A [Thomasclavelia cocleata]MCR1961243.1 replication-associated recombination protein A [Thomasclavelia cocleata]NDO41608.1 replication-associated recombination protein A [Thomasclavelia cocleata]PJN80747.1 replication-associated recombination protein A [Thomasclavelia cocleata]SET45595.1 Recombination protein MgsA [Thomasclavelia cocleata]